MADKNTQTAFISFIDKETGNVLAQDQLTGQAGEVIEYSPNQRLGELAKKGYSLDYSGLPKGVRFSANNGKNQVFAILLGHDVTVVDPTKTGKAGTPLNPNDPDGAKWPDPEQYQRTYRQTVSLVDQKGKPVHQPLVERSTWQRQLMLDKVTGKTKPVDDDWHADISNYPAIKVPVVAGYVANQTTIAQQPVITKDISAKVTYQPVGQIVPVLDDEKTRVPGVKPAKYQNDPNDPTKVLVNQPVPTADEFTPDQKTIEPSSPTADTKVVYRAVQQKAVISFVDADSGDVIDQVTQHGKVGTMILYNPLDELEKLSQQGYQMVKNGFTAGTTYRSGNPQQFEIQVRKSTATPQADEGKKNLSFTFTTHFVDQSGQTLHKDNVQRIEWSEDSTGQYKPAHDRYNDVPVPVIEGYCTDRGLVPGHIAGLFNTNYTVMYRPLGHFIPVDEQGKRIKDATQSVYRNDPNDPTRIASKQAIPQVPGYKLAQDTVNPTDPSQDTPITYHQIH